jgi:hypothetical protein
MARSTDSGFYLERHPVGAGPHGRWARFRIVDRSGTAIGVVEEDHGDGRRYLAAAASPGGLQCRTYGHATPAEALHALIVNLHRAG